MAAPSVDDVFRLVSLVTLYEYELAYEHKRFPRSIGFESKVSKYLSENHEETSLKVDNFHMQKTCIQFPSLNEICCILIVA